MPVHVKRADLVARSAGSGLPYLDAIARRQGATRVYAALVTVPSGGKTVPHDHVSVETVISQTPGRVRTYHGPDLAQSVVTEPGDFLFIPPGEIHQAGNEGDEPAEPSSSATTRSRRSWRFPWTRARLDVPGKPQTPRCPAGKRSARRA